MLFKHPSALHFSRLLRLAFLQKRSERLKLKKRNSEMKSANVIPVFSIVQSNEWRGGPSVVEMEVYSCLESHQITKVTLKKVSSMTAVMEEKLVVSVEGIF